MAEIHIQSVQSPFDDPTVMPVAIAALSRADAMGLLSGEIACLDDAAMRGLGTGMAEAGIGRDFLPELQSLSAGNPARLCALLGKINQALDESPAPTHEWQALQQVLGLELLARLLGISVSSARRYYSGARSTPDPVAARLHFLAFVVGDLAGAYNDIGVRRWFDRPRKPLGGTAPARLLVEDWSPDDEGPRRVRELARALRSSPAT